MPKRSYLDFATDNNANVTILTADGGRIPAHAEVLRLVCSCMKNAPASDTWDLRDLLIDGKAPRADTVEAVLELIYSNMHVLEFQMDKSPGRFSVLQLCDMLLFADSIGCSRSFLEDMAAMLGGCFSDSMTITVGATNKAAGNELGNTAPSTTGTFVEAGASSAQVTSADVGDSGLSTDTLSLSISLNKMYFVQRTVASYSLSSWSNGAYSVVASGITEAVVERVRDNVKEQVELLLYTACKLEMPHLLEKVLQFVRNNTLASGEKLLVCPSSVFTARVATSAATGPCKTVLMQACTQHNLGVGLGLNSCFTKISNLSFTGSTSSNSLGCLLFSTTMGRELYGLQPGAKVEVALNLADGGCTLTSRTTAAGSLSCYFGLVLGSRRLFKD